MPPAPETPAMRQLREARAALEAATKACDTTFRAWADLPPTQRDMQVLSAAARDFSEAQRRVVLAEAAARQAPARQEGAHRWATHAGSAQPPPDPVGAARAASGEVVEAEPAKGADPAARTASRFEKAWGSH